MVTRNSHNRSSDFRLPNAPTYVVAGDSAEARIFLTQSRFGDWNEVLTLTNPGADVPERERVTDKPGRAFDSFGKGRHSMGRKETKRQNELRRFAREVGHRINGAMIAGEFEHLVLIAEPTFLGYLRQELSTATTRSLCCEVQTNPAGSDLNRLKSLFT